MPFTISTCQKHVKEQSSQGKNRPRFKKIQSERNTYPYRRIAKVAARLRVNPDVAGDHREQVVLA